MTLGTAEKIILIILSSTLAIFLILSIVVTVLIIKLLKHIKRITEKAEQIADKADAVTSFFEHTAGPAALVKLVSNIVHSVTSKKDK